RNIGWTLCTERRGVEIVARGVRSASKAVRTVAARNYGRAVQEVRETGTRVANVETEVIGDRHILDRLIEALARVASFESPVRSDGPINASDNFVLGHWAHVRLYGRITRIRLGCAEVHVFDEAADRHTRSWTGGSATGRSSSTAGRGD